VAEGRVAPPPPPPPPPWRISLSSSLRRRRHMYFLYNYYFSTHTESSLPPENFLFSSCSNDTNSGTLEGAGGDSQ